MRVSDVIRLSKDNVRNEDGNMKSEIAIIEKKTKKTKIFPLVNGLLVEMEKYTRSMKNGDFLFPSRKGSNTPITTTQAYRIINSAAEQIGLEHIGTHSMRKTFRILAL